MTVSIAAQLILRIKPHLSSNTRVNTPRQRR
jgi:hypothetical protein